MESARSGRNNMPIFEQACKTCNKVFEIVSKYIDRHNQTCPDCKNKLEYIVSAPGAYTIKGNNSASTKTGWSTGRSK